MYLHLHLRPYPKHWLSPNEARKLTDILNAIRFVNLLTIANGRQTMDIFD